MTKIALFTLILSVAFTLNFGVALAQTGSGDTGSTCIGTECDNGDSNGDNGGASNQGGTFTLPNPLECKEANCILNTIIRALIMLGAPLAVLMILIGAFQIMTAGGSTEKVETGRKTITYAVIGFAVLLLASSFIYIIKDLLGVKE